MFFAVSIAYFRFYIVQVSRFMAGSCYPSWFATESALYCVLEKCLVRRNGTSCSQNTVEGKQVSSFFRAECGSCQKLNSTECRLHVRQEQYAHFKASHWQQERTDSESDTHPKYLVPRDYNEQRFQMVIDCYGID